jgi:NAD(P)-dependent dehydrogenase (short-subunit alcohol dehydrogenase family)
MLKAGGGSIINNASVAGLVGFAGIPAYCAAKGAVIQLTKCAAMEYATQGVRVNAICPGVIWTPMVQRAIGDSAESRKAFEAMEAVGRFGTPGEIANMRPGMRRFQFCTGAPFIVDGGFVAA